MNPSRIALGANGEAKEADHEAVAWYGLGIVGLIGGYYLWQHLKGGPGVTETAPVAPIQPPEVLATLQDIDNRFTQVRELYHMGYLTPDQALSQIQGLEVSANELKLQKKADPMAILDLTTRFDTFKKEVEDFIKLMAPSA